MTIAFDRIITEYGWSDEYVLDLTMRRFRWAIEAIERRLAAELKAHVLLVEAQTRTIAQGFKVLVDKKGGSKFDKWIGQIRFWKDPAEDELDEVAGTFRGRPLPDADALLGTTNRKR
jgi:hypothetical protein